MTKMTATNNSLLCNAKRIFNSKIYAVALLTMNTKGENATIEYLLSYIAPDCRQDFMSNLRM